MMELMGFTKYETDSLFDGNTVSPQLDFLLEPVTRDDNAIGNLSVSGVQDKYPAVIDGGRIRLTLPEEQSTHILKPAPMAKLYERKEMPANEHLTMQIAHDVYGIKTAANALCYSKDGHPVYITRRFDVNKDGTKYAQEDFSVLTKTIMPGDADSKYSGCYADIAAAIKLHVPSWPVALDEFFKLVVFNYIYANGDAHLKNFSILLNKNECVLAPAYDLINTELHVNGEDFALKDGLSPAIEKSDVYERTGHPCKIDFERFGKFIGVTSSRIKRTINMFSVFPEDIYSLVQQSSFRNDSIKRNYLLIIEERRKRFIRETE